MDAPQEEAAGPFLNMAVICERFEHEPDGRLSIRSIGQELEQVRVGPAPKGPHAYECHFLFFFVFAKGAASEGKEVSFDAHLVLRDPEGHLVPLSEPPAGQQYTSTALPIRISDGVLAAEVDVNATVYLTRTGVYRLSVRVAERLLTEMPFRVLLRAVSGESKLSH